VLLPSGGGRASAYVRAGRGAIVMETVSLSHWLVVLVVVLILFREARVPSAIGDLARGTRAFRAGMKDGKTDETGGETLIKAHPADRQRADARAAVHS